MRPVPPERRAAVIDAHMHVNYRGMDADDIIGYMDRERIDRCWLLTWEEADPPHPFYQHLSIDGVFEAYGKYGDRIIPMYAPDPSRPDAAERLEDWAKKGIMGCGELKCVLRWDAPGVDRLLDCVDRLGLPLVFHMEEGRRYFTGRGNGADRILSRLMNTTRLGGATGRIIEAAAELAGPLKRKKLSMQRSFPGYLLDFAGLEARLMEYPNIKFVGHGPFFWKGFTAHDDGGKEGVVWRLMENYRNLHVDLSASGCFALKKRPALAKRFLDRYSRRIMYGTDNFFIGLREFLDSLNMGADVRRRIYSENAESLLASPRGKPGNLRAGRPEKEAA